MVLRDLSVMSLCQKGEPSFMGEKVKTTLEAKLYDCRDTITNTSDYFLALWMGSDEFTTAKISGVQATRRVEGNHSSKNWTNSICPEKNNRRW